MGLKLPHDRERTAARRTIPGYAVRQGGPKTLDPEVCLRKVEKIITEVLGRGLGVYPRNGVPIHRRELKLGMGLSGFFNGETSVLPGWRPCGGML